MKMSQPAYDALKKMIEFSFLDTGIDQLAVDYKAGGLSQRRFCFDVLYALPYAKRNEWFEGYEVYNRGGLDLNDDQIYTALKKIIGRWN